MAADDDFVLVLRGDLIAYMDEDAEPNDERVQRLRNAATGPSVVEVSKGVHTWTPLPSTEGKS